MTRVVTQGLLPTHWVQRIGVEQKQQVIPVFGIAIVGNNEFDFQGASPRGIGLYIILYGWGGVVGSGRYAK